MTNLAGEIDLHVHTFHSYCASPQMTLEAIAKKAMETGLSVVGLADHFWLDRDRGCRPAVAHILLTRNELVSRQGPVRFLLGAESDCSPSRGAAGGEELSQLDYAVGSYHFAEVRENEAPMPLTADALGIMLAEGFRSIVEAPHIRVAGHPLHIPRRIYRAMNDSIRTNLAGVYRTAIDSALPHLKTAARRGVAIEMNVRALFPRIRPAMFSFYAAALKAGCQFSLTCDAHRPGEMDARVDLAAYADELGLSSSDFLNTDTFSPRVK